MKNYTITIYATTVTSKTVEIEAANWEDAEEAGRMIYEREDASAWQCETQDFEVDVMETYEMPTARFKQIFKGETDIIDEMREARAYDNQPRD